MAKYLRYALASVCFAASVACLALWWRSFVYFESLSGAASGWSVYSESCNGIVMLNAYTGDHLPAALMYEWGWAKDHNTVADFDIGRKGVFGIHDELRNTCHFPHWYLTLIFALAGVGVLCFRRQFSIRSALICVSVVASLLGMAVAL